MEEKAVVLVLYTAYTSNMLLLYIRSIECAAFFPLQLHARLFIFIHLLSPPPAPPFRAYTNSMRVTCIICVSVAKRRMDALDAAILGVKKGRIRRTARSYNSSKSTYSHSQYRSALINPSIPCIFNASFVERKNRIFHSTLDFLGF